MRLALLASLLLTLLSACGNDDADPPFQRETFESDAAAAVIHRLLEESAQSLQKPNAPHCLILGEIRPGQPANNASAAFMAQFHQLRSNWVTESDLGLDPKTKAVVVAQSGELPVILQISALEEAGPEAWLVTGAWSWQAEMVRQRYQVVLDPSTSAWTISDATLLEKRP
ncbi:MAG TPA: hypothetical protein VMN36_15260 [Verrucomicrobiales bacterium]|nr:hypothetical protein [Verrucomicrobiales bacterium]